MYIHLRERLSGRSISIFINGRSKKLRSRAQLEFPAENSEKRGGKLNFTNVTKNLLQIFDEFSQNVNFGNNLSHRYQFVIVSLYLSVLHQEEPIFFVKFMKNSRVSCRCSIGRIA